MSDYESPRKITATDWLESIGGVVVIGVLLKAFWEFARSLT